MSERDVVETKQIVSTRWETGWPSADFGFVNSSSSAYPLQTVG